LRSDGVSRKNAQLLEKIELGGNLEMAQLQTGNGSACAQSPSTVQYSELSLQH
jgi:hypothetical protein